MKKIVLMLVMATMIISGCSEKTSSEESKLKGFTDENGVTYQVLPIEAEDDESYLGVHVMNGSDEDILVDESMFKLKDSENTVYEPTNADYDYKLTKGGEVQFKLHYDTPDAKNSEVIYDNIDSNVVFS